MIYTQDSFLLSKLLKTNYHYAYGQSKIISRTIYKLKDEKSGC